MPSDKTSNAISDITFCPFPHRLMAMLYDAVILLGVLIFASADIKSLLDQFFAILGLFGGALGGMFLLGMFTTRAHGKGAVMGAIIGAVSLFFVSRFTDTHVYLYAAIGVFVTITSGWILSLLIPDIKKDISGLTVYDFTEFIDVAFAGESRWIWLE